MASPSITTFANQPSQEIGLNVSQSMRDRIAKMHASLTGRPYYGPRVEFTIWNVTPSNVAYPVGAYTGWTEVPSSVESARRTAHRHMADLRACWTACGDVFEVRRQDLA